MTTGNTGSDQSTVDDVASASEEDAKGRNEVITQFAILSIFFFFFFCELPFPALIQFLLIGILFF